ncbi:MAG TPA: DHA2 family efflux MFS transporter permease subunit [Thermoanaerobaculia bacterium]|jgi:DHA2 family multidrug resistance protein|nr:DHA2 family efflux MFS transporter permease subunit [Thermoanaerobaculia bacterium]
MTSVALPISAATAGGIAGATQRKPVNKWLVTLSITFGTLMGAIDTSIVTVAVPHLTGSLGVTVEQITWVTTGFIIATVMVMPLTGFLARMFGQKRVYLFCLVLFGVGSALCGMARTLPLLVFFRVLQGLGAGALQPTEQAILRQTFPPQEQGMAMAVFGMAVVLGPAFGPTLGGYIVDNYSWPWIFYINVPVCIVSLLMVTRFVHEPEDVRAAMHVMAVRQRKNLDWSGIALLIVGLGTMQYVLEEGNRNDWFASGEIKIITLVALVSLVALVIRELSAAYPAVDFSLFRDMVFTSGTLIGAVMFAMLMTVTFLLPLYMQTMLGFSAMQSGLALMPRSLTMLVVMPIVGRIYNKVSPRIVVAFGILLFAYTAWLMGHYTLATSSQGIVNVLIIQGVAFSCLFIPLTTMALSTIPRHRMPDATGLNALLRQTGGSVGLAVFATVLTRYATRMRGAMLSSVTMSRPEVMARVQSVQSMLAGRGLDPLAAQSTARRMIDLQVRQQSMVLAFEKLFMLSGICFLCVLPLVFLLRAPKGAAEVHVEM